MALACAMVLACGRGPSDIQGPLLWRHEFPEQETAPGKEKRGLCRSWTLENDTELWVNAVELSQSERSHHSNWVWVPEERYAGPDGIWPCSARAYELYDAIQAGGLLYAQSTQAAHEIQRFPAGAAVRVPPRARIISDIHIVNTGAEAISGHATLTLHLLAEADVKTRLSAFHAEYDDLAILPHASHRYTANCSVADAIAKATGEPFAPKIHYLLPHTHALATRFFAEILGGPDDGRSLLDLGGFDGEARGVTFDPPVDLAGAEGLRFGCQYQNPNNDVVYWGNGPGEMCELFGFAEGAPFFQAHVDLGAFVGKDGETRLFEGDCVTTQPAGGAGP